MCFIKLTWFTSRVCIIAFQFLIVLTQYDNKPKLCHDKKNWFDKKVHFTDNKNKLFKNEMPKEEEETLSSKFGCSVTGWLLRLPAIKLKFPRGVTVSL